ncbi:MAG: primosomal protein N' [Proteobacteria bacterium]|nr:primosomal protein N' [Pseudomonadota bacterium]
MYYYHVAPSRPFMDTLTYESEELIPIGCRVEIPIGKSKGFGFVVEQQKVKPVDFETRKIIKVNGEHSFFNKENLNFYKWVSEYYHYPLGETLSLIIPSFIPKRKKTFEDVEKTYVSQDDPLVDFTEEQKEAERIILDPHTQNTYSSRNLLHGVTGSGKTEVYIEIAKETIKNKRGVIIIVPEIALTPQLINRISAHFKGEISVIHSEISRAKKYETWIKLSGGKSLLCIGARSAIFSPMPDIGLIVVDEEQDSSYKQDDRLRYNARDLALVLGKQYDARVILSSATPSVETYHNAKEKKYSYVTLRNRVRGLCLPKTIIVDLKKADMVSENFSTEMVKNIKNALDKKEQIILYLNRRGYSNTIICKACGTRVSCPRCSITLTEHKNKKIMLCHYCGFERDIPNYCSACKSHSLYPVGSGTEKIYEEIETLFPEARIARMDSDSIKGKKSLGDILKKIADKKVDIIVGTQLLGKGHDFPEVTMVGIINADVTLHLPDFRSAEKTFHQVMQVSGRAGRMCQGLVVLQSYIPEHFAIQNAIKNDYDGFYSEELTNRKEVLYPPFVNLVDIKFSSNSKDISFKSAKLAHEAIQKIIKAKKMNVITLGPTPSPIPVINNRYRHHIVLKGKSRSDLNSLLKIFNQEYKKHKSLRLSIDVDPYSFI